MEAPKLLSNFWHQNCQKVPWLYFQNIFRLQPLLLLSPWCKLLLFLAWSFAVSCLLLHLLTSVLSLWSLFQNCSPRDLIDSKSQIMSLWLNTLWWFPLSLKISVLVYMCLPHQQPPPTPRPFHSNHAGLLVVPQTCLHALTAGPLHNCFLYLHYSSPRWLHDLLPCPLQVFAQILLSYKVRL